MSAGDALLGQPIEDFNAVKGHFVGVIGGPPCQKDSTANRTNRDPEAGLVLKREFFRVVAQADPEFFLMEGVNGLPLEAVVALVPSGFKVQRLHINARELGFPQNRERWYVFGYRVGNPLVIPYVSRRSSGAGPSRCCIASEFEREGSEGARTFADFCELQGLPREFSFPGGFYPSLRYRLVGNGVHVGVARVIAGAIRTRGVTVRRVCVCECGREVPATRIHGTDACRKRMQRRRDAAPAPLGGPDTAELSLLMPELQTMRLSP